MHSERRKKYHSKRPYKGKGNRVSRQEIFNNVIPFILKQGRCFAPGHGVRYELPPGQYWTGQRYDDVCTVTTVEEVPYTYRDKKGRERETVKEREKTITHFKGNKVYEEEENWRYSPVKYLFSHYIKNPRHRFHWPDAEMTPGLYMEYNGSPSKMSRIFEGFTCDSGERFDIMKQCGFDPHFCRAIQEVHDDLTLNTQGDWIEAFDDIAIRFNLKNGVRQSWMKASYYQRWNYHKPQTNEAIKLELLCKASV